MGFDRDEYARLLTTSGRCCVRPPATAGTLRTRKWSCSSFAGPSPAGGQRRRSPARAPRLPNALVTTEMRTWGSATPTGRLERDLLGFALRTADALDRCEWLGRPGILDG